MRNVVELKALMEKVNDYWIAENPDVGDNAWERAAYFLGNIAAYDVLKKQQYLDYAIEWANANDWDFNRNENHNTTNADNVSCGETYMDLMTKYGVEGKNSAFRCPEESLLSGVVQKESYGDRLQRTV